MSYKYLAIGVLIILITALYFRNYLPFFNDEPKTTPSEYTEELAAYNKAIALKPDDFRAYVNQGIVFDIFGKHELAIKSYDKALELNPNDIKAHFNKAITLEKLDKYDLALESYNTALEINPDYSEAKARKQAI